MTKEGARQNLSDWLFLAARANRPSKWDELCEQAYDVIGHEDYARIYKETVYSHTGQRV